MSQKEEYSYYHYMETKYRESRSELRKGERTRLKLLMATIRLLDDVGYHGLTTANICKAANLSSATIYLYFKNRKEIVLAVLDGFAQYLIQQLKQVNKEEDRMTQVNRIWIYVTSKNSGLLRCLLQMRDEVPEFDDRMNHLNHDWYLSIARSRNQDDDTVDPERLMIAYAMGGMVDELTRSLFTRCNPYLNDAFQQLGWNEEQLADFITSIWKSTDNLFGKM